MPNPLQMDSSVEIDGVVLRRNIFARVDSDSPHFFDCLYSVQERGGSLWGMSEGADRA